MASIRMDVLRRLLLLVLVIVLLLLLLLLRGEPQPQLLRELERLLSVWKEDDVRPDDPFMTNDVAIAM